MEKVIKNVTALCIGALSLLFIGTADAGPGPHGGFRGGIGFHSGYGFRGGIGFGGGYRGGFGFRGGFYGYPALGLSFGYLPYGYWPFYFGSDLYYCYDGIYYRQYDDSYRVVAPPLGAEVPKLPAKAKSIVIDGQQYFVMDGVYYKEIDHQDGTKGYQIAGKDGVLNTGQANTGPQVGDSVTQLPDGSRPVSIAGKKYFVSPDDVYYEQVTSGGTTTYRVVGVPTGSDNQTAPVNQQNQGSQSGQIQTVE